MSFTINNSNKMKRRKFIANSATALTAISIFPSCITKNATPEGEEWRLAEKNSDYRLTYNEADLEALETAKSNINKYRKKSTAIKITDANGKALSGIKIKIQQLNTPFDWGCSSVPNKNTNGIKNFVNLFNCTTAKCYWDERWHQPIETEEGKRIYDTFLKEINIAVTNGLRVKGHPLVWTVRKALPIWLDKYEHDKQIDILKNHVQSLIKIGGTNVSMWDLCNEMLWEPSFRNYKLRNWPHIETIDEMLTYIEPSLQWARAINPNAVYALNDYGLEITYRKEIAAGEQRKRYVELVNALKNRNCAPDALGTQTHVGNWYNPELLKTVWDELAQAGIPLQISEYWAHIKSEKAIVDLAPNEQQFYLTRYLKDCYTLAFGHPAVNHFTYWGNEHFFDEEGNTTHYYKALHQLIKNEWMTNTDAETNSEGLFAFNGFAGEYLLTINDKQTARFSLLENEDVMVFKAI
jgi:endo-1,4-beta-xylanase